MEINAVMPVVFNIGNTAQRGGTLNFYLAFIITINIIVIIISLVRLLIWIYKLKTTKESYSSKKTPTLFQFLFSLDPDNFSFYYSSLFLLVNGMSMLLFITFKVLKVLDKINP